MGRKLFIICVLLAGILSCDLAVAGVSSREIAEYIDWAPQEYSGCKDCGEVVKLLNANLPRPGLDAAAAQLAKKWGISSVAARHLMEALLLSELPGSGDRKSREQRMRTAYLSALDSAESSPEVWAVFLDYADSNRMCAYPGLKERFFAQKAAADRFVDRDNWNCSEWIVDYPKYRPMTPLAWWYLFSHFQNDYPAGELAASQMLVDTVSAQASGPMDPALLYALRRHLLNLASFGLPAELIGTLEALNEEQRQALLMQMPADEVTMNGNVLGQPKSWRDEVRSAWVLALLAVGRQQDAARWLESFNLPRGLTRAKSGEHPRGYNDVFVEEGADESEFLHRLVAGGGAEDPYDLFVGDGERGFLWSWHVLRGSILGDRLVAQYMRQGGYDGISRHILQKNCMRYDTDSDDAPGGDWVAHFPREFSPVLARYAGLLSAGAADPVNCIRDGTALAAGANAVSRRTYRELPLSAAPRARTATKRVAERLLPQDSYAVRAERIGDAISAITLSQDVDPVGEISGGGYWLQRSVDGGKTWLHPLYLGLQQYYPYVVPEKSRLPLIRDRTLQLEIEVQELDEESIMFPPVGLRSKREAKGLYIELPLDELEKDADGDQLTDLLEEKLRTDPRKADTDDDGIPDALDDFPQVSARAAPHAMAPIIVDVLRNITGYEAGAIQVPMAAAQNADNVVPGLAIASSSPRRGMRYMFFNADPAFFTGVALPGNAIVLTDADVKYLQARFGLCFPVEFPVIWFNRDRTRALVRWNASWVGGTLSYRLIDGKWVGEETSRWIT